MNYRIYANLAENARDILQRIEQVVAELEQTGRLSVPFNLLSIYNHASLDQFRAGYWQRAYELNQQINALFRIRAFREMTGLGGEARANVLLNLARLWVAQGKPAEATICLEPLLKLEQPRYDLILPEIVRGYQASREYAAGLAGLENLVVEGLVKADNSTWRRSKAQLLVDLKRYDEALQIYNELSLPGEGPGRGWLILERAGLEYALGRESVAHQGYAQVEELLDSIGSEPMQLTGASLLRLVLAKAWQEAGNFTAAESLYSRVADQTEKAGLEGIAIRAEIARCKLAGLQGMLPAIGVVSRLENLVATSGYRQEVLEARLALAEAYLSPAANPARQAQGIAHLIQVALDNTSQPTLAIRAAVDRATTRMAELGLELPQESLPQPEPAILTTTYQAVSNLSAHLKKLVTAGPVVEQKEASLSAAL
ncbi:MAG TPA: hypothetical protein VH186_30065 [Chloroflexia bacterium]|nr:hypothetical protein [Chloroflexia bacterium]